MINWLWANWLWVLVIYWIFGDAILGLLSTVLAAIVAPFAALSERKHRREREITELTRRVLEAQPPPGTVRTRARPEDPPRQDPGSWDLPRCHHEVVKPVREEATGKLVAWMCQNPQCTREFPPDSQVLRTEDK
jgi:hypothetical protein